MSVDYSLYLITDEALCGDRGVAATAAAAVAGGATLVQVRAKGKSGPDVVHDVAAIRAAISARGLSAPVIVNDSLPAAIAAQADGLHLGQSDGDPVEARKALGAAAILGLSVSTAGQVQAALDLPEGTLDYLGIGPVWATATKPNHPEPLGPQVCGELAAQARPMASVVIAGIDAARVVELGGHGFDGICVVSAICASADPEAAARELRDAWDAAR